MMYGVKNSAAESDTLDIYIYSDIVDDITATLYKSANIELMSAAKFQRMLDEKKNAKQINLFINSPGGDVMDGVAIYGQIRRHNAHVTAYIDGWACSIASVIPMAADKVVMSDTSMMMIHHPWSVAVGNSDEFRKAADTLDSILEGSIIPAYKSKCGDKISDSKLREFLKNEKMLTAKECLQYGFCDEITERKPAEDETKAKEAVKEAQNQAKISYMNRLHEMYASLKMPAGLSAVETPKEQDNADAEKKSAEAEKNDVNAAENAEDAAEKQRDDVSDINDGNMETGSEPEEAENTPEPVEDKVKTNDYFMKLLKGEM
jgi:ATP-dependent protease ClpP protease subunit